jgi:hypothetical protein
VRRVLLVLAVALVMVVMALVAMPAFAQGPEGGNPGNLLTFQERTVGANDLQPLPFGGTEPEAGFTNAPKGVVCTAPGSPHYDPELSPPC